MCPCPFLFNFPSKFAIFLCKSNHTFKHNALKTLQTHYETKLDFFGGRQTIVIKIDIRDNNLQ
jgi:hypothetical protein